jgi:hypothetical protein
LLQSSPPQHPRWTRNCGWEEGIQPWLEENWRFMGGGIFWLVGWILIPFFAHPLRAG